ncbi:Gfo/Idh/MocA family protein [Georgenia deserti]|uniref:Gfo/Idh/MocA family protein n=1 Tax=Georgenia deserti TaxID=2093781 RepID=A0ABW4L4Y7_9MICO
MSGAQLRLGVVGVGARARLATHAGAAGARVVAAADPDPRARERAEELFGAAVSTVADHRDLLDAGLDGVLVLTPDDRHASVAVDLLDAGVPVYLEKPMATTLADCDAILAAQARSGMLLVPGHNMRHVPVVTEMRRLIEDGAIGEVMTVWCRHFVGHGGDYYFKDWHADASRATGLLLQKGAHDIDVIHWLAGGHTDLVVGMGALQVYGSITDRRDNSDRRMPDWFSYDNWPPTALRELNPVVDVEDTSMLQMHLDNGVLASYTQCHFTPDYWRNYTVIGTAGRLENFGDLDGAEIKVWNRRTNFEPEGHLTVPVAGGIGGHGGADASIIAEFCAAVRGGATPRTTPLDARAAVATGVCGTESIRAGSVPVRIPPPVGPDGTAAAGGAAPAARDVARPNPGVPDPEKEENSQ